MKYRLVISDVDSTLIEQEVIDALAAKSGHGAEVSKITEAAMAGELDFRSALIKRVQCLAGLPVSVVEEVASEISLSPGAMELKDYCKENGLKFGAVTGGFYQVLELVPFFTDLDFLRANTLEIRDGYLTGKADGQIVDRNVKAESLSHFASTCGIELDATVAIGDGANDMEMLRISGLGIAFRGKDILKSVADVSITGSLNEVIALLK